MGVFIHAVHYTLVIGGMVGVALMLLPQLAGARAPRTAEEQRIADLRYTASMGMLGTGVLVSHRPVRTAPLVSSTWLPVAIVASAAAAGVHAAVGPAHLAEGLLVGSFFILSSMGQLAWSALALRHATPPLLYLGLVGNLACIALWLVSRTIGLPITGVEPVGAWDLTAALTEATVAVACLHHLSTGAAETAVAPWIRWSWFARAWLVACAVTLGVLTMTGSGA